jgi:hypothetical protein
VIFVLVDVVQLVASRRTDKSRNSSNLSARSSTLARKHAKAEAARARLEFVEKQNGILKEQAKLEEDEILAKLATVRRKAKLDADLSILCHQKDVASAIFKPDKFQVCR